MEKMNVVILNQHCINFGDEAAGSALLGELVTKYAPSRIDILYNGSSPIPFEDEKIYHHFEDITLRQMGVFGIASYLILGKSINRCVNTFESLIQRADIVLVAPGGANIGIYKDWRYLVRILMAEKAGATPVFHWNTIGKSGDRLFDSLSHRALKDSRVYVREQRCADYLSSIGVVSEVGPDTAFLLDSIPRDTSQDSYIAFVPSYLDSWHPYFKKNNIDHRILSELVPMIGTFALEHNLSVEILPHYAIDEEVKFDNEVENSLKSMGVDASYRSEISNYLMYDKAISQSLITVGMRYHACVLAAKNAVPFLTIAYENKAMEVCRYTNMEDYAINLQEQVINFSRVDSMLEELLTDRDAISQRLQIIVEEDLRPRAAALLETEISNITM